MEPSVEVEQSGTKAGVGGAGFSHATSEGTEQKAEWEDSDSPLAATLTEHEIVWDVAPAKSGAFRHVLHETLPLSVLVRWPPGVAKTGSVAVYPDAIQFFDAARKPISRRRSLLMYLTLKKAREMISFRDELSARFEVLDERQ